VACDTGNGKANEANRYVRLRVPALPCNQLIASAM